MRASAFIAALCVAAVTAAPVGDWHHCLTDARCRDAYQQHTATGDRNTFDTLYARGQEVTDNRTMKLLARVAHLGSLCPRNEIFSRGECTCPTDIDGDCGEVTPFNNNVIYAACAFSAIAIVLHVWHDITKASGGAHDEAETGTAAIPTALAVQQQLRNALRERRTVHSAGMPEQRLTWQGR